MICTRDYVVFGLVVLLGIVTGVLMWVHPGRFPA